MGDNPFNIGKQVADGNIINFGKTGKTFKIGEQSAGEKIVNIDTEKDVTFCVGDKVKMNDSFFNSPMAHTLTKGFFRENPNYTIQKLHIYSIDQKVMRTADSWVSPPVSDDPAIEVAEIRYKGKVNECAVADLIIGPSGASIQVALRWLDKIENK